MVYHSWSIWSLHAEEWTAVRFPPESHTDSVVTPGVLGGGFHSDRHGGEI